MFFIRVLLGIIFFFQGYGKIFTMGVSQVYDRFFKEFENTILPKWLDCTTAYYTSYVELIGGILLIIGLFRKQAMYLLAMDLLIVSFGHGLHGAHLGSESRDSESRVDFCSVPATNIVGYLECRMRFLKKQ